MCAKSLQLCPNSATHGLQPARLFCPWDSPGKSTGVGCHALLQGIFWTQASNLHLIMSPALTGRFFTTSANWEVLNMLQIYPVISLRMVAIWLHLTLGSDLTVLSCLPLEIFLACSENSLVRELSAVVRLFFFFLLLKGI